MTVADIDAVLLLSFGGPEAADQVRPFLERVSRGRGVPPERLDEVEKQYLAVGGCSPINEQNRRLRAAIEQELAARSSGEGASIPVYWGNRNWHPFLADTLRQMRDDGIGTAAVVITSAYSSYSGCRQYREDLAEASRVVQDDGQGQAPLLLKVRRYFDHPAFVSVMADNIMAALGELPLDGPPPALIFTTHSIPVSSVADSGPVDDPSQTYLSQHQFLAARLAAIVGDRFGTPLTWDLVFQSRSGPPSVPWLEPDIGDHLTALAERGTRTAVIVPIGFISDHMEVAWDLDVLALGRAREVGMTCVRAATVGTDTRFVSALVDLVRERMNEVPTEQRPALGPWGPAPDLCPAGCCRNPRGSKPALCGLS